MSNASQRMKAEACKFAKEDFAILEHLVARIRGANEISSADVADISQTVQELSKWMALLATLSDSVPVPLAPYEALPSTAKTQQRAPIAQQSLLPEQDDAKKKRNLDRSAQIRRVFRHWRTTMSRPAAKLTPDRVNIIARALFKWGYTEDQLIDAINGCAMTPHNMGIRDDGKLGRTYNDLELILRDASHIERFAETAQNPPERNINAKRSIEAQLASVFADAGQIASDSTMYLQDAGSE